MFNIVRHFWLLITVKKYIKKYKLKVKVNNHFNSIRITTATNTLYFITFTKNCNYGKKLKKLGGVTFMHKLFYLQRILIITKYLMNISNY